jgi:hypothetical protein
MDAVLDIGFTAATSACHQKSCHAIFHDFKLALLHARGILLPIFAPTMAFDTPKHCALLFQVLAIALRLAPPQAYATSGSAKIHETTCVNLSRHYSYIGVNIMNLLGENGRGVTAVEHYFVRAWWLKNNGRKADSWHSLGTAIRFVRACPANHVDFALTVRLGWPNHLTCTVSSLCPRV